MSVRDRARQRWQKAQSEQGDFKKVSFWKPSPGGDLIRMICPPYIDDNVDEAWLESRVYGFNLKNGDYYACNAPSFYNLPDIIAEHRSDLLKKGEKEKAKAFYPSKVFYSLIVDLNDLSKGVQIYQFKVKVRDQLDHLLSLEEDYEIFYGIDKGHDLRVSMRKENGFPLTFINAVPKATSLDQSIRKAAGDQYDKMGVTAETIMQEAGEIDLAWYIRVDTDETLSELLHGDVDEEDYRTVFEDRRKERDAIDGRPQPLYLEHKNTMTKEEAVNKQRVRKEDEEFDDPFRAPSDDDIPFEDSPVGKWFEFEDVDDDETEVTVKGECLGQENDEDGDLCYTIKTDGGTYVVPVSECKEVPAPKKAKFKKPVKSKEDTSILDQVNKLKDDTDD